jgi:glucosamine--fructose-6-phosphate aminotransferase (isomerizing)
MCGIVAYVGKREALPILIKGLKRLEYRGYDSAGIAVIGDSGETEVYKKQGKVQELEDFIGDKEIKSTIGIGHTRWATHGVPSDRNAHPHYGEDSDIAIIHNGIIENYDVIKASLIKKGRTFESETDTEVLIHFIEDIRKNTGADLEEAVRLALNEVHGAYAIVIIDKNNPNKLIAARKSSPLVIGIGENEFFLASDATPLIEYTKEVVYLDDEELAIVDKEGGFSLKTIKNEKKTPYIQELELELDAIEKGGFDHYMLKEIFEQPTTVSDAMRGKVLLDNVAISLGGIEAYKNKIYNAKRIIIVACGTSWHSGLIGEYLFEDLARIPVEVDYASEFRYRNPILNEDDVVIAISQSGETADTLAAIELAKEKGATVVGICNVVGSSIARITDTGVYTHSGPEIGVASTKAFTGQVMILTIMAMKIAYEKGRMSRDEFHAGLEGLELIPKKIGECLTCNDQIEVISSQFKDASNFLYLGRGYNFPVALEGALKLKEISYIHAEGYPAAEMKHGPIALIDEEMPCVFIATNKSSYEKILSNMQEVKARSGKIISVVNPEMKEKMTEVSDYMIEIPSTLEYLTPLLSIIPMQLLSYHIAVMRGCNVDQPRNLAKSVTVE